MRQAKVYSRRVSEDPIVPFSSRISQCFVRPLVKISSQRGAVPPKKATAQKLSVWKILAGKILAEKLAMRSIHIVRKHTHTHTESQVGRFGDFFLSEGNSPLESESRLGSRPGIPRCLLRGLGVTGERTRCPTARTPRKNLKQAPRRLG